MRIYNILIFAGLLTWGCNGQTTGRLEQREAHYEVHKLMDKDLQEMERRHSNKKHEHDQWVISRSDTVPTADFQALEQRHTEIEARHSEIIAEHHRMMEEHHAFFETRDDMDIPREQWRARYKEIEVEHERMEKDHKQMRADHEKMEAEHRNFEEAQ